MWNRYLLLFVKITIYHPSHYIFFTVKKFRGQRAAGDVAHLQTHEAGEEGEPCPRQDPSTQVPPRHLRVSFFFFLSLFFLRELPYKSILFYLKFIINTAITWMCVIPTLLCSVLSSLRHVKLCRKFYHFSSQLPVVRIVLRNHSF